MASLPPGWKADYDGQRWFFTYGPTGQSQFQFPRPGDEFPDVFCYAGGGAILPAVELLPEERLESERQVRRMLNVGGGSGATGGTGDVADEKEGLRGRVSLVREGVDDDGDGNVCFESFAAVKSRGRRGFGDSREGTRAAERTGRGVDDGVGSPVRSVTGASGESTGEKTSLSLVVKGEHAQASSLQPRAADSAAIIPIMSEPVLAVVENAAAVPSLGPQSKGQPAVATQTTASEPPILNGNAMDSTQTALSALSIVDVPELYSESTALCEVEINPPPVELPGSEGGWNGHLSAIQSPVELPVSEEPGVGSRKGSSSAGSGSKSHAPVALSGGHAVTTVAKSRGHDRAGLPSQALRSSSKIPLERTSIHDSVNSTLGQEPPTRDTDQPAEIAGTEPRDLAHFPSVLRPGPRRSGQLRLQQPGPSMPAPATIIPHAAHHRLHQPYEYQHNGKLEAAQGRTARMPAMPPALHPHEASAAASTTSPEAPHPDRARQNRLPGSVSFVIPIDHVSRGELRSASALGNAKADPPEYRVSASFAPARSSKELPRTERQRGGGSQELLPGKSPEPWGRAAEDDAVPAHPFVSGGSAPRVPQWSWGYAR